MTRKSITLSTCLFLTRTAFASPYFKFRNTLLDEGSAEPGSSEFWTKLVISVGLVLAGGVFAGYVRLLLTIFRLLIRWLDFQTYSWFDGFG
jgi:metal transporter CNNM